MAEWADMTPRERDALVAEKVFGALPRRHLSHFTTSIADAWQVLAKATEDEGLWSSIESLTRDPLDRGWRCSIMQWHDDRGDDGVAMAEAPTAPEAICLAALRAVGVEVSRYLETPPLHLGRLGGERWWRTRKAGDYWFCDGSIQREFHVPSGSRIVLCLSDQPTWGAVEAGVLTCISDPWVEALQQSGLDIPYLRVWWWVEIVS